MVEQFDGATCRGCYALGTACGCCERCEDEKKRIKDGASPEIMRVVEAASKCCVLGIGVQNRDMTHPLAQEQFGNAVKAYADLHEALRKAGMQHQFEGHPSESSRPQRRLGGQPLKHA